MSERKISKKSLENLKISNQESNRITKESLEISLLQLLEKKELAKITISELVERAGVSRAAFYRNYDSKEEILQEIFQRTVQKITDKLEQFNMRTELYQVWLFLFKEVKKEALCEFAERFLYWQTRAGLGTDAVNLISKSDPRATRNRPHYIVCL